MGRKVKALFGHSGNIRRGNRKRIFRRKKVGILSLVRVLTK